MYRTLWLTSWYPSRTSSQNGDFIQRHAQAASLFAKIYVLYVVPNKDILRAEEIVISQSKNLTEEIVYYRKKKETVLSRFFSVIKYFRLYKRHIKKYIQQHGTPDIVNVQVSMRAGILALWLKRKYNIPYVITEHWTIYTPERKDNFYSQNFLFRYFAKKVFKHAALALPDSEDLGRNIQQMVTDVPYIKLPNVVSSDFYLKRKEHNNRHFIFIHASSLIERKNPQGIVRAFARLLESNNKVFLQIIGSKNQALEDLARELNISSEHISFTDQIPYEEYAVAMRNADAFVLFSHSENFGCVVVESLCCGNPVIVTDVGGVAEQLSASNGILIPANNEQALLNAMKNMIDNYANYDREAIAKQATALYNYNIIGKQIVDIYEKVLHK